MQIQLQTNTITNLTQENKQNGKTNKMTSEKTIDEKITNTKTAENNIASSWTEIFQLNGAWTLKFSILGSAIFAVSVTLATIWASLLPLNTVVSLTLFSAGIIFYIYAMVVAAARSRYEQLTVAAIFMLAGAKRKKVTLAFYIMLALVTTLAITASAIRLWTATAFSILAPTYILSLMGVWGAKYEKYGNNLIATDSSIKNQTQPNNNKAQNNGTESF